MTPYPLGHRALAKCVTKILKKPYFCSAKTGPQEVVLFLTLEVILFLTLERPKSGTKTNSPAYIYTHIYIERERNREREREIERDRERQKDRERERERKKKKREKERGERKKSAPCRHTSKCHAGNVAAAGFGALGQQDAWFLSMLRYPSLWPRHGSQQVCWEEKRLRAEHVP